MNLTVMVVGTAVVAGGLGFAGGMQLQKTKVTSGRAEFAQGGNRMLFKGGASGQARGGRGGMMNGAGGFLAGEVLSKDATGITVKLRDGGSKIVFTSGTTTVSKPTDVKIDELKVGDNVMVAGKPNSDGSITAENIQIRPAGMMPALGGAAAGVGALTNAPAKQ